MSRVESGASIDTSSPGQQLNSVQKRYIQLCKDPSTPPWARTFQREVARSMQIEHVHDLHSLLPLIYSVLHPFCLVLSLSLTVKQCSEWIHVGGPCYYFSKMTSMESLRSRDSCAEMGGHLTTLHTIEQHVHQNVCVCVCDHRMKWEVVHTLPCLIYPNQTMLNYHDIKTIWWRMTGCIWIRCRSCISSSMWEKSYHIITSDHMIVDYFSN